MTKRLLCGLAVACVAMATLVLTTASANATAILAIDFNNSTSPTESGFVGQSAASFTHSTTAGDLTVAITDQQGNYDRGVPATHGTNTDIYRDFFFDNSNKITLTLSGPAVSANTDYDLTFYAYDEAQNSSISFTGVSGTSGSAGPIVSTADAEITSLGQFADTATFTSDGSGVLTIDTSTSRPRINGFEISPIPEPSTFLLTALGLLGLLGWRRRRRR